MHTKTHASIKQHHRKEKKASSPENEIRKIIEKYIEKR